MYQILLDNKIIYEPYMDTVVTDATLSSEVNASDTFVFTVSGEIDAVQTAEVRTSVVELFFDNTKLFEGYVVDIEDDIYGEYTISCISAMGWLSDTLVRPYSTVKGEAELTAPSSVDGYFDWLIEQHNEHVLDTYKQFTVGINQGDMLDTNNYIYRSSTVLPTTSDELKDKLLDSLGGYLFMRYDGDKKVLDLYADVHDMNAQLIDFGENMIDFERVISGESMYTAMRPSGNAASDDDDTKVDISSVQDGIISAYDGLYKNGDIVYSPNAVKKYGYREYALEVDSNDPDYLLTKSCVELNKVLEPSREITVKAVDMALYAEGYTHLQCGQAARVRVDHRNVDEYLLVSSINLDIGNPENTEYVLGDSFDSLTGKQSAYVQALNTSINKTVDSVDALSEISKNQAVAIGEAVTAANKAVEDSALSLLTSDKAEQSANEAKQEVSEIKEQLDGMETSIRQSAEEVAIEASKNAVSEATDGILDEAKEYTDSQISVKADEIVSTVQSNVESSISGTYATKTEVTQTSSSLTTKITKAQNAANDAADTADAVAALITLDSDGITVGNSKTSSKAKVTTDAKFQITNNNGNISIYRDSLLSNSAKIEIAGSVQTMYLGGADAEWTAFFSNAALSFSCSSSIPFILLSPTANIESYTFTPRSTSATGTTNACVAPRPYYSPTRYVGFVKVYWYCTYTGVYGSTCAQVTSRNSTSGSSNSVDLVMNSVARNMDSQMILVSEKINVSFTAKTGYCTVTRGEPQRAAITADSTSSVNGSPGTQFYIYNIGLSVVTV